MHLAGFGALALAFVSASAMTVPLSIQVNLDEHDLGRAHISGDSSKNIAADIINDMVIWTSQCDTTTQMIKALTPFNMVTWVPQIVKSYNSRGEEMIAALNRLQGADKVSDSESREITGQYNRFTQMFEREIESLVYVKSYFMQMNHNIPAVAALRMYESAMGSYIYELSNLVSSSEAESLHSQYRRLDENLIKAIRSLETYEG